MWKYKENSKIEIDEETFDAICSIYQNRPLDYYIKEKDTYLRLIKHIDTDNLSSLWLCLQNYGDLSDFEIKDLNTFGNSKILIMEEYYDVLKTYDELNK